jgi:UPF0716 protein FxsA
MMRLLPLLFFVGLVAELTTVIVSGSLLGMVSTLLLLLAGCFLGLGLIKSAGTNVISTLRSPVRDPTLQKDATGEAVSRAVSGVFFLIPGFFSDIVGVLLLLPSVRRSLRSKFPSHHLSTAGTPGRRGGTIIDVEAVEIVGELNQPGRAPREHSGEADSR